MSSSRRSFMRDAALIVTAAGAVPRTIYAAEGAAKKINLRDLGSTGYKVSEVGMGCMNMRDPELVQAAIDSGINYFDTAYGYMNGANEEVIGGVIKNQRGKVFVTTKIRSNDASQLKGMLETSLKRLQTDHVDLILMHGAASVDQIRDDNQKKAFESFRKEGKARFIGFSTHSLPAALTDAVIQDKFWQAVLVSYNYQSPAEVSQSIRRIREAGIATIAMKTQVNGKNTNLKAEGMTPHEAALKWVLNDRYVDVAIPGMTSFEHLAMDIGVMGKTLTTTDEQLLRRMSSNLRGSYCSGVLGCTGCQDQCPKGVALNEINRCLGYAYGYGNIELARENYRNLATPAGLERCADCSECTVRCMNGINLTKAVRQAETIFV